jgi:hypothetical protein
MYSIPAGNNALLFNTDGTAQYYNYEDPAARAAIGAVYNLGALTGWSDAKQHGNELYVSDGNSVKIIKLANDFSVSGASLKDAQGNDVTASTASGEITAKCAVNSVTDKEAYIIAAVYDGEKIKLVPFNKETITGSGELTVSFTMPTGLVNPEIKVMVWDGFNTMNPLADFTKF